MEIVMPGVVDMKKCNTYSIYILRLAALIAAAVILLTGEGCARPAEFVTEDPGPAFTAAHTPRPEGLKAVLGKGKITVAAVSNADMEDSKLFFKGAQAEAEGMGVTLVTNAAGEDFKNSFAEAADSSDAAIACLINAVSDYTDISGELRADLPVCVLEMSEGNVPEGVSHIYYSPGNEASMALDAALSFTPHDTPVRLILMFESKESESYKLYRKLYGEGKIFPKEVYIASEQNKKAVSWLTGKLENYVEGMIDAIYAEDEELAIEALGTLEALGRGDMEVFCPGVTAETVERMIKNPDVFAQSAGANTYLAGALCLRAVLKELKGDGAVSLEMQPCLINASGLKDGIRGLLYMGGQDGLLSEDWMEELKSYYGPLTQ